MRGKVVSFASVDDLPLGAAIDAETFRRQGVKSQVMIPLVASSSPYGAFTFSMFSVERRWREDEITDLKLAAQIIGHGFGLRRAELREEQLHSELVHTMRVATLGDMVTALAHELNQPLAAILSNAQAARRFIATGEIQPDELREILDDMVRDDKRAGSVIHNLRAMVSKRPAVREACRLNELITEVIALLHSDLIDANISVHSTLDPDLPCVEAAHVELQQVLVNLFSNAVHAMEKTACDSRVLAVETRVEGPAIVVLLRDHGPGIPPEKLSTIFNPFYSTKATGLGMGLSICRRIIENHGGRIEARNCSDGGAAFRFTLPIPVSP
jgi:C4-dicarboxylate-specific signal transduction histidine kinase